MTPDHKAVRRPSAAGHIVGAVASFLVLSLIVPVYLALIGALRSAPFFGEQPSASDLAQTASLLWVALAVSLLSLAGIAVLAVLAVLSGSRRGRSAVVVFAVLGGAASLIWMAVATSGQSSADQAARPPTGAAATPSASPTVLDGRLIPGAQGTADATDLVARLKSVAFPGNADPETVRQLVAAAGGDNPETAGTTGDVAVGAIGRAFSERSVRPEPAGP